MWKNFKRSFNILSIILISILVIGIGNSILFGGIKSDNKNSQNVYENMQIFTLVLSYIQKSYVDEVPVDKLIKGAIKGMIGTLDPHSQFMEKEEYSDLKIQTKGTFGGLGIVVTIKDNILTVVSPIEDTPAFKAGILSEDRIVKINDEYTKNMTLYEAINKMRGEPNTKITIGIFREGHSDLLKFTITRAIIPMVSVKYFMLPQNVGYVRITDFKSQTGDELEKALIDLEKKGMQSLVLDLRHNPGGLLNVAVEVSNKFISKGRLIVYTKGRIEEQNMQFFADKEPSHPNFPIAVLVNNGSASASEIVSGAIQDWNRGVIVGTKSFGKASVQSIIPIGDSPDSGLGLRLTTAKYYTPSGKCIHGEGIMPDVVVEMSNEQQLKIYSQRNNEENLKVEEKQLEFLKNASDSTSIELQKSLIEKKNKGLEKNEEKAVDTQLQTAIEILKIQLFITKNDLKSQL